VPDVASECAGTLWPARPVSADLQKVGCASRPLRSVGHDLAHKGRHWIGVDDVLDRGAPVVRISGSSPANVRFIVITLSLLARARIAATAARAPGAHTDSADKPMLCGRYRIGPFGRMEIKVGCDGLKMLKPGSPNGLWRRIHRPKVGLQAVPVSAGRVPLTSRLARSGLCCRSCCSL
jgi:hypothetical protein